MPFDSFSDDILTYEDTLDKLIQDEIILPEQIAYAGAGGEYRAQFVFTGIKGLAAAAFLDGISLAVRPITCTDPNMIHQQRRLKEEAIEWVRSRHAPQSFEWYCEHFGIDYLRCRDHVLHQAGVLQL